MRGRAEVARQAHNLEAVGSIPTPATNDFYRLSVTDGLFLPHFREVTTISPASYLVVLFVWVGGVVFCRFDPCFESES